MKVTTVLEKRTKQTPFSNTGSDGKGPPLAARCHWLQGTWRLRDPNDLLGVYAAIAQTFRDEVIETRDKSQFHGTRYDHSAETGTGIKIAYIAPSEFEAGRAWIGIPGSALDRITLLELRTLGIYLLNTVGLKVSRYDAAIDDYTRRIEPMQALQAAMHGAMRRALTYAVYGKGKRGHMALTAYFGDFSSDKFVRCYDKWEESGGEIDAIRWEAQFRDELAHAAFKTLIDSSDARYAQHMAKCIARQVVGAIDFVDTDSGRRYCEQTRLDWWQTIVDDAGGEIKITVSAIKTTIEKKLKWIETQVAPALAQIFELAAPAYNAIMKKLRTVGRNRMKPLHYAQITAFQGLSQASKALVWQAAIC